MHDGNDNVKSGKNTADVPKEPSEIEQNMMRLQDLAERLRVEVDGMELGLAVVLGDRLETEAGRPTRSYASPLAVNMNEALDAIEFQLDRLSQLRGDLAL